MNYAINGGKFYVIISKDINLKMHLKWDIIATAQKEKVKLPTTKLAVAELLARYIPLKDTWNPADESLYKPVDLYRVPLDEAEDMQLKAIKYTFTHHYSNNGFYHTYCEEGGICPDDIKTVDDLDEIPLIPDATYKEYPSGRDFARWLATVFTGKLPKIVIKGLNPTFDDVINAFNAAGLVIAYSSGTSGRLTFIPRDMKTFSAAECAFAKLTASMTEQADCHAHSLSADHYYLLSPNPTKTNLFIGKASSLSFELIKGDVQYAMDDEITVEVLQRAMRGGRRAEKASDLLPRRDVAEAGRPGRTMA